MKEGIEVKQLRSFGFLVGGIFALMGVWPVVFRGEDLRWWAVILAVALIVPALILPKSLGPVYRVWMKIGHILGLVNTRIILTLVFYGLFTPIGLVMRLLGKDPMYRQFEPDAETYRVIRSARPASHMLRQF